MEENEVFEAAPVIIDRTKDARKRYSRVLTSAGLMILIYEAIFSVISAVLAIIVPEFEMSTVYMTVASFILVDALGYTLIFLFTKKLGKTKIEKRKLGAKTFFCAIIVVLGLTQIFALVGNGVSALLDKIPWISTVDIINDEYADEPLWSMLVFGVILAPLFEELIFRKTFCDHLVEFGELPTIIVSAVAFGLFHQNFYQFFFTVATGAVLAWLYVKSGKIILPVAAHMIMNFIGGFLPTALNCFYEALSAEGGLSLPESITSVEGLGEVVETMAALLYRLCIGCYNIIIFGGAIAAVIILIVFRKKYTNFDKPASYVDEKKRFVVPFVNSGAIFYFVLCAYFFASIMAAYA